MEWEGVKPLILSGFTAETDSTQATAAAAENVKKLRSLASRILPRLDNSGRKEMDFPVFDTLVITSFQLESVLQDVADHGLPGEHHFFITFDTKHPDVQMADWLFDRLQRNTWRVCTVWETK